MKTPSRTSPPQPPPADTADKRKRTIAITLLALGAGAVTIGAFSGAGTGSGNRPRTFKDVTECEADKSITSVDCSSNFKQALSAHERSAPAHQSREGCEREYGAGNCTNPSAGSGRSSMFIPVMAGYMLGRQAAGGFQAAPLYRRPGDPQGEFRQSAAFPNPMSSGSSSSYSSGSRSGFWDSRSSSSTSPPASTSTTQRPATGSPGMAIPGTSRGGFGASSRGSSGT